MKVKSAKKMYDKFISILNEEHLKFENSTPNFIQTDKGTEFPLIKKKCKSIIGFIHIKGK